mgnify:CR=1 FL=1
MEYDAPCFRISNAGISITDTDIYLEDNYEYGILCTRKELRNIGKPQIIGHTPHELQIPLYNQNSNSYNIDSVFCYGRGLTGIIMNKNGELVEIFLEKVDLKDLN